MHLTRLAATVVLAIALSLVAVTAASAAKYPGEVRKAFISECFKSAKKTADGSVSKKKLKKACKVSLRCIEGKLTLKQFERASVSDRPIKKCIQKGARAITG